MRLVTRENPEVDLFKSAFVAKGVDGSAQLVAYRYIEQNLPKKLDGLHCVLQGGGLITLSADADQLDETNVAIVRECFEHAMTLLV